MGIAIANRKNRCDFGALSSGEKRCIQAPLRYLKSEGLLPQTYRVFKWAVPHGVLHGGLLSQSVAKWQFEYHSGMSLKDALCPQAPRVSQWKNSFLSWPLESAEDFSWNFLWPSFLKIEGRKSANFSPNFRRIVCPCRRKTSPEVRSWGFSAQKYPMTLYDASCRV